MYSLKEEDRNKLRVSNRTVGGQGLIIGSLSAIECRGDSEKLYGLVHDTTRLSFLVLSRTRSCKKSIYKNSSSPKLR